MKTRNLLLLAAVGAGIAYLLTSKQGRQMAGKLVDSAGELKDKLSSMEMSDLKTLVSKANDLGADAKDKILSLLGSTATTAKTLKNKAAEV